MDLDLSLFFYAADLDGVIFSFKVRHGLDPLSTSDLVSDAVFGSLIPSIGTSVAIYTVVLLVGIDMTNR